MLKIIVCFIEEVGQSFLNLCEKIGFFSIFSFRILKCIVTPPFYLRNTLKLFFEYSYGSLGLIALTNFFSGMVMALQSASGAERIATNSIIPSIVILSLTRELTPVLSGLMLTGRIGASIASEIATMKVTDQLKALATFSVSPYQYLFAPMVIASVCALPLLVIIGNIIGVMGGSLISVIKLNFSWQSYFSSTWSFLEGQDVILGLLKSLCFGWIFSSIACFWGYESSYGSKGVGDSTKGAVVTASVVILLADYIITNLYVL